jgi:hypothetical protein
MTDTEKLNSLISKLREFAEAKHCYDVHGYNYTPSAGNYDTAFNDGADYGEIELARTLLEGLGINFEYPCMREENDA